MFKFDYHNIKTFADACKKLGIKNDMLISSGGGDIEAQRQAQALYKLLIIQKAMNNGIWHDEDGWSYYPYWVFYSKREMERMSKEEKQRKGIRQLTPCAYAENLGIRWVNVNGHGMNTSTHSGFPLCFNSEDAALYAGKQFIDIWADFVFNSNK